jgi:branched-chain amino acid transport system substrate-binding protein
VTTVEPFKVGFLDEGLFRDAGTFDRAIGDVVRLRFAEAVAAAEVDRPIELIVRTGRGLPHGTAKAVEDAWTELADDGALVIIGPGITDNCIAVLPLFEARGVPTINFPGTTRSRGRYGFHYQVGSLYDDGPLIARAAARRGLHTVAVIRDRSPIGEEFFEAFEEECERTERIHQVGAALGGPGTVMGFGPWERTALKGADYLILRQMSGEDTLRYTQ